MEISILFLMAVIVLRGFFLEGYLISTGSMAPQLLGLHKKVTCPECQHTFAFGVTFDESVDGKVTEESSPARRFAACPNCGQMGIDVVPVPTCHGDQLLVHKSALQWRHPKRFESVVFRNPASPGEAYVKRVVGFAGETIQIANGDIFIGGRIARKDLTAQREMRIEVFDFAKQPTSADWQQPLELKGNWKRDGQTVICSDDSAAAEFAGEVSWLHVRNWRRSGGIHFTEVPFPAPDAEAQWQKCLLQLQQGPVAWHARLRFDRERQVLSLQGVMPEQMQQAILQNAAKTELATAIHRLAALSHLCPITDRYGYNSAVAVAERPVHDMMLTAKIVPDDDLQQLILQVPVRNRLFRIELNLEADEARLIQQSTGRVVRTADLSVDLAGMTDSPGFLLEVSNFDHRVQVAVNGELLMPPLDIPCDAPRPLADPFGTNRTPAELAKEAVRVFTQQNRFAIGARGGTVRVRNLHLYRDVHYTPGRAKHAVKEPHEIPAGNYFMLGDNSPVSADSRNWKNPNVAEHLLVGKPFIVHLPSRPGKLTLGGYELPIRIPDFDRIRYIH